MNAKWKECTERMYEAMQRAGLTVPGLSTRTHIPQTTLYSWLNCKAILSADKVPIICKALNISADWLLGVEDSLDATEEFNRYKRDQAAAWLGGIRKLNARIKTLQQEIDAQRELASGLTCNSYDGMPHNSNSSADSIPNAVIRINEMVSAYCGELLQYVERQSEAHKAIQRIEDDHCRAALTSYYLLSHSWEKVCEELKYSWDGMMKLRRRALVEAYEVMPPSERDPLHPAI